MAGGYKSFGPTYNSTPYVRLGYEGTLNGTHEIDVTAATAVNGKLAGKMAAVTGTGIGLAADGTTAVGLFREDLGDMTNASLKASFYFRGGEYYVAEERLGAAIDNFTVGTPITCFAGEIVPGAGAKAIGVVTHIGEYKTGNMYEWATGLNGDGRKYLGFILYI